MTAADDRILEFLLNGENQKIIATPGMIELNIDYGKTHISNRLKELREADLVEYYDEKRGAYQITERGEKYLKGQIKAEQLENQG
ncbi:winged helix DNA-binding protein [Haloparvum sp. AD34]